jgi:hypothetical protein
MLLAVDLDKNEAGKLGRMPLKKHFGKALKNLDEVLCLAFIASDYMVKKGILTIRKKLYE